jgi:Ca2+-transporting ATPase
VAIFLAAGAFAIAGGIPLTPLQILWLNMVVDIPIAVALGFDQASPGLMARTPRPVGAPVLSRADWLRLGAQGLVMTVGTLVAYQIGNSNDDPTVAATTLLTTLSLFHLVAGLLSRDQRHTVFDRAAIPGTAQLRRYALALLAILAVTMLGPLQRIVGTTSLSLALWGACLGLALSLVAVEEVVKLVLRHRGGVPARPGLRPSPA